ncbi:MAG TPA: flagellar hook-basal body protein [Verrucomicrobiae bacterium]|nr:flagellar hook-basal body protein [Verrucomicrobiae bacterium]
MNVSLYQAAAALNASARWQEVISDNLAASSVPGFKKQELSFSAVAAGATPNVVMPSAGTSTNFQQGQIRPTGVLTDVAIDGDAFFEVQLPSGQTGYTRDGEFQFNAQGELVTKQGYAVQSDSGAIQIDLNNPAPLSIAADGTVSQGSDVKGQLKLTTFNDTRLLHGIGNGYYIATDPNLVPSAASTATVRQGYLEAGNASPVVEMAHLIGAMRQYEANQRVIQTQDDRMNRAISELGNPST